jgi:hypothetical protein
MNCVAVIGGWPRLDFAGITSTVGCPGFRVLGEGRVPRIGRHDLAQAMALAVRIRGDPGTDRGELSRRNREHEGVQSFVVTSDSGKGGTVAYPDVIEMIEQIEAVNADQFGDQALLTTPGIRLANTIALAAWADDDTLGTYMARSSNQVPKTRVRGSISNNHALIFGVWATIVIGM